MSSPKESERDAFWWVVKAITVAVILIATSLVLVEAVGCVAVLGLAAGFLMLLALLFGSPLVALLARRRDSR